MPNDKLLKKRGLAPDPVLVDEDDSDSGGRGGSGGIRKPKDGEIFFSSLKEETTAMENERRHLEQAGHRQYGDVNARERQEQIQSQGNEETKVHGVKQHPLLQTQRFDGIDSSLNPAPPDNPDALAQFENERAEQEKEKQLRLGLDLKNTKRFNPTYTPR